jgi:hypothetical protein
VSTSKGLGAKVWVRELRAEASFRGCPQQWSSDMQAGCIFDEKEHQKVPCSKAAGVRHGNVQLQHTNRFCVPVSLKYNCSTLLCP